MKDCLCPNCYAKIKDETNEIKEKIIEELKLDSVDKEVVVVYDGENDKQSAEFWNGKQNAEMENDRFDLFSLVFVPSAVVNYSTAPSAPPKEPSLPKIPQSAPIPVQQQQRPVSIHGFSSFQQPLSPLPSLQTNFSPQYSHQTSYHGSSPRGWSHVESPRSPGVGNQQPKLFYQNSSNAPPFEVAPPPPSTSLYDLGQPQAQIVSQVSTPQQQIYQQPQHPQYPQYYEDTPKQQQQQQPFMGTPLRKEAPITQKPAPVYQSQPVAATFQGGANMRGDTKWPPTEYKMQAEVENEERRKLALGPVFRPKRVNKDYSRFFAQNALSNTYPGYRVPPGTLHIGNGEFL
ncbi:unnamed protein product [Chironomus riparius]|uniref:Uncharacterized protein n=1 Tax=Chironomus riparius TaxID=315576 RepID=A0A9N9WNE9_9DIPT|nr:unnamed protein product [Chironomus riparius]